MLNPKSNPKVTPLLFNVKNIVKILVSEDIIDSEGAKRVLLKDKLQSGTVPHPLVLIAQQQLKDKRNNDKPLTVEGLTEWLADKMDIPYLRIDPLRIDVPSVTAVVSYAYASRRKILPVEVTNDTVVFATSDPHSKDWVNELNQLLRKKVERVLANPDEISRYLNEFYNLSKSVKGATRDAADVNANIVNNLEQLVELGRAGKLDAEDHHVVHIVDWLLQYAFDQRASDIHIEPRRDKSDIRFRIDGVLHLVYQVPPTVMTAIVSRIKTLGRMDISEKRRPQDGRLKTKTPDGSEIELRLSTVATALGEKMVLRIFDPEVLKRNYRELGLTDKEFSIWDGMVKQPHGIVLVTGPTGSGKTTTLYSTLKQLATEEVNVCTVEDPIEMVEPRFNQLQVQTNIDVSFASGVRALLRQDPDIIMVGEIRDMETADMAVQAALTGHLVLSTLHTNDAPSAVTRLLEIGVPSYLINATVLGVVAQRLVRTLCPHCKAPSAVEADSWRALVQPWKIAAPKNAYGAKGCLECRNTGFFGRMGLYEILSLSPSLRQKITPDTDLNQITQQSIKEGLQPLRISGAKKISSGHTTIEEVMRVIPKDYLQHV